MTPDELLMAWLREGWAYRVRQGNPDMLARRAEYKARVDYEMSEITAKCYQSYFLMVSDIIRWAKRQGIAVGPGRGSSASSLVCWLLLITEPNPMLFPLADFTRFIDPTRTDLPDIDIDFDDSRRHEVRAYCVRKYGADHVGNVANFVKWKGKNSIDDVSRVFQLPKGDMETLKGMIVERSGGDSRADNTLMDTLSMFENAAAIMAKYPALRLAAELEGNYRGMSVHSAGLIIGNRPLHEITAQYTREVKGRPITSIAVDKYEAETLNLMKVDLLGLSTMGMIADAIAAAGISLQELYSLPLDDPDTLAAFERGDVYGIFQFEGRATRLVTIEVKPNNFLDLIDINALSRPGPLFSGTTAEYIAVKHGRQQPTRLHPIIDRITKGTRNQVLYQEQILHCLAEFGGLSVRRVHEIRRIISKKLGEAQFNTSAEDFATNAMKMHGVSRDLAMQVWRRVVTSASYAFVYSHSLAYTQIGYWAMWLKVHYPAQFYAAQLNKIADDKWPRLMQDAEKHGVRIRGVDPRNSGLTWKASEGEVIAGWLQVPGVGPAKADDILAYQQHASDKGLPLLARAEDLLVIKGIGPKMVEKMRKAIDDPDPFGLKRVANAVNEVRTEIAEGGIPLKAPTHTSDSLYGLKEGTRVCFVGVAVARNYQDFIENQRSRTGKEIEEITRNMKRRDLVTSCVIRCIDDGEEDVYLRINRFTFPKLKRKLESVVVDRDVIWVTGRMTGAGFGINIAVDQLEVLEPEV